MRIRRTLPPVASPIYLHDISKALRLYFSRKNIASYFSSDIKRYFEVRHCFLLSSGRAALTIILKTLKELKPDGDEVIIPAFTCYSVAASVIRAGLKIRLCDIDRHSLDFDFDMLVNLLREKADNILAVVPVHLFGSEAEIKKISDIITKLKINTYIVEDAAQCLGIRSRYGLMGTLGDVAFFSLGRGKSISSVGGGIIITNNDKIGSHIREVMATIPRDSLIKDIRHFLYSLLLLVFMRPSLYWLPSSIPFLGLGKTVYDPSFKIKRISPFQVAIAMNWRRKVAILRKKRIILSRFWSSFFDGRRGFFCFTHKGDPSYELIRFPLLIDDSHFKDMILKKSYKNGLGITESYPDPINKIRELRNLLYKEKFPNAEYVADHLVTLPVHPFVSKRDLINICRIFEGC